MSLNDPFIPVKNKIKFPSFLVNIFIGIVKLPIFLILFSLSLQFSIILSILPFDGLKNIIYKNGSKVVCKIILILSGVYNVIEQPTTIVDTYSKIDEATVPGGGDLIIANCTSFLNIIWLQSKYVPIFVVPYNSSDVYVFNVFQILTKIFSSNELKSHIIKPLKDVLKSAKIKYECPVVIFPEGSVTNGQCIINFHEFGKGLNFANINLHIFGFVHFSSDFSPSFTYGNPFLHLFFMMSRTLAGIKVKIALQHDIQRICQKQITCSNNAEFDQDSLDHSLSQFRLLMSQITNIPLINVDSDQFQKTKSIYLERNYHHQ